MKKFIAIAVISTINLVSAMDQKITIRSAEAIKSDFKAIGTPDTVINRLDFHGEFGGKTMPIQAIETKIQEICEDRINATPEERRERTRTHVQAKLEEATAILLNQHPEALKLINQKRQELKQ